MALTLQTIARNAGAEAITDLADAGSGAGKINIRTGSTPGAGTLLATFTLSDPAFTGPSTGVMTLDVTPALTDDGLADGTAGIWDLVDSDDTLVLSGSVTATGGGGDLELNTTSITTGVEVEITAGTITMPAS